MRLMGGAERSGKGTPHFSRPHVRVPKETRKKRGEQSGSKGQEGCFRRPNKRDGKKIHMWRGKGTRIL